MPVPFVYKKNPNFPQRYISPKTLHNYLQEHFSAQITQLGTSTLGAPIYMLSLGSGPIRVLAWSQMHGNESNGTHAMLDLLYMFNDVNDLERSLLKGLTLDFIFMLNPDGAKVWNRRNALDIDMNRDFYKESSKEFRLLKEIALSGSYQYGLNLHEQRTIFTTDGIHPATLSFLAPSENQERDITETRQRAMAVIAKVFQTLDQEIPHQIGRYTDEFYPTSTGDNFTRLGLPTILFEGGHYVDDYSREGTRKWYTKALLETLLAIGTLQDGTAGWEDYEKIPENRETHYDVIYRNVTLNTDFPCALDVAVQFREVYKDGDADISFVPIVVEVGDCGRKKGWKEIDCTGKFFKSERKFPKLDAEVDFEII